jgi:hypothetical protein
VRESAHLETTPGDVQTFARRIDESDVISKGSTLIDSEGYLANRAAQEWLVVDADNKIYGVLMRSDIPGAS